VTPRQLAGFKKALLALRAEQVEKGSARIEPNRTDETSSGVADEDAQALSEMLQAINSRRNAEQAALIAKVDRALRKLEKAPERFGLCEECEEEIAPARLKALPHASLCLECQGKRDPARGQARRKTTDFL
jgi:DnaK suppressor protein